jgi:predicted transcriptional regulator YdeE
MFGVSTLVNADGENPYIEIPQFWERCISDGTVKRIRSAAGLGEHGQIHAVLYNNQGERFSYMIGYFLSQNGLPQGFEKLQIPPQTYAISQPESIPMDRMIFMDCGSVSGASGFRVLITNLHMAMSLK